MKIKKTYNLRLADNYLSLTSNTQPPAPSAHYPAPSTQYSPPSPSHHLLRRILFMLLTLLFTSPLFSQHYPIQVTTMVTPPYSLRLSDYVESGYDRIQVNINPLDLNLTAYKVKLKLIIESVDGRVRIETDPNYLPAPVFLQGGVPEMLTSYDIQDLFDISHLAFTGMSKNEYIRTGHLPEGFYRIGFEALDYNRATLRAELQVSNYGNMMAGLYLNDPPLLNMPQNSLKINIFEPQQIFFQWTPRHKGSVNSAFNAEYVFRLYEVWNEWADPNVIARSQMPIFETVVTDSRYLYGIADPLLIPGKKYVWAVQVREEQGRDLFRNNGLSEAYMFTYGDECKAPTDLNGEPVNGPGMELNWKGSQGHTAYSIDYRPQGSDNWYSESSLRENSRIYELQYDQNYEVRVMAQCGSFDSPYTETLLLKMPKEPRQTFACGANSDLPPITSQEPLPSLVPGISFTAGGFRCKVTEVTGSNGIFSGKCLVEVPFYGYAKVLHTFENIRINSDMQMTAGVLKSVTDEVKNTEFMAKIDEANTLSSGSGNGGYTPQQMADLLGATRVVTVESPITLTEVNDDGDVVVTCKNGDTEVIEVEEGEKVLIADSDGNRYVYNDGIVTDANAALAAGSGGTAPAQVNNVDSARALLPVIRFAPAEGMHYGYDSLKYGELKDQYEVRQVREEDYSMPYKSVATGTMDVVNAKLPAGNYYNPAAVSFRIGGNGTTSVPAGTGNERKVNVAGIFAGQNQALEAVYKLEDTTGNVHEEVLGALNVVAYDKLQLNLIIVPVNHTGTYNGQAIQDSLNNVYAQAVTGWNVTVHEPLIVDDADTVFDNTDNDDRMDYTPGMKKVYRAYKKAFTKEKDAVYLFMIKGECTDTKLKGYMPFNGQYAYIFTDNLGGETMEHAIAHEIAHGAFNLRHTFSPKNKYIQPQGGTDNLMDYAGSNARQLNKYQWDLIHNPDKVWFEWLQDEQEGAMTAVPISPMYAKLFDHINSKNQSGKLDYLNEIASKLQSGESGSFKLEYTEDESKSWTSEEKSWIDQWQIRIKKSDEVFADIIEAIQNTAKGEKIPKIVAQPNKIYIGKYTIDNKDYCVAVYGQGEKTVMENKFTKVQVKEMSELNNFENAKHIYCDETFSNYLIISFYEENKTEPSLIMQVSSADPFGVTKSTWLKYLGVLVAKSKKNHIIKLYEGDKEKTEGAIFNINTTPEMPDIRASVSSNAPKIELRLKIAYNARKSWKDKKGTHTNELVRDDSTWFPGSGWKTLESGKVWDVGFENKIRGGKAYLICKLDGKIADTLVFHIRGTNPSDQEVHSYLNTLSNADGWYVPKIIRQESSFHQFNPGTPSATNTVAGMPNWGPPYGWGIKQLDNLGSSYGYRTELNGKVVREGGASPEELWDWKDNIKKGIEFFNGAKLSAANTSWNNALDEIEKWEDKHPKIVQDAYPMYIKESTVTSEVGTTVTTITAGTGNNTEIITSAATPNDGQRSLRDADAIKRYNGGAYISIYIPSSDDDDIPTPQWQIDKTGNGRDYVNDVCGRNGW